MLVGGDLGLLLNLVVAGFVLLLGPLVGFVARRKWRRALSRREEVKRLLVLASEEAVRAEIEAAAEYGYGYSYSYGSLEESEVSAPKAGPEFRSESTETLDSVSRQLQYQCAVCFSPTTTRCSRCKAVRYCSGKCQILHWREGHKDDCTPVSNSDHINNVDVTSHLKAYKQERSGSHANSIEAEVTHSPESNNASPAEDAFLLSKISGTSHGKDDTDEPNQRDEKSTNLSSNVTSRPFPCELSDSAASSESSVDVCAGESNNDDGSFSHQSAVADTVKVQINVTKVNRDKPFFPEQPNRTHSVDTGKYNQTKPSLHRDTRSKSSTSISSSVDGSRKSSFSEPSTTSGFWEGAVPYSRAKIESVDNVSFCSSKHAREIKMSSSTCHPPELTTVISGVDEQGSKVKKNLENPNLTKLELRKPTNHAESKFEVKNDFGNKSSSLGSVTSDHLDVQDSRETALNSKEIRHSSVSSSGAMRHLKSNGRLEAGSLPSPSPNSSSPSIEGMPSISQISKSRPKESLASKISDSHLSSTNGRHEVGSWKPAQVNSACSSEASCQLQNVRNGVKSSVLKVVDQLNGSKLTRHDSVGAWCEGMGRYNKGIFPYESFVKLYNSNKVELRPFGLINCGNSCYANAVLQCLAFTPPLTSYFLLGLHTKACDKKEWCFTCEFESLVLKAKDGNSPLSPIRIISHLENIGSSLGNGREEDAHEFLRYVVDTMQSICLKEARVNASGSFEEETTLVGLTFGGYLRSKIECMTCGGRSERQERMMDLTVEIDGNIGTLEEALKQFTRTEILDGENKYKCGRCKSYVKARKKLKVLEAPNVLTVTLKRFESGKFGKLNKTIKFPEFLNLAPYMSGTSDKSPVYQLYGVVVHLDIMNAAFSGHYVCYVKNFQNKWFKVDDSSVKGVELERVLTKGAYMLLYARCSPRAPRFIRSLTIPRHPKSKQLRYKSRSHKSSPWDFSVGDSTGQTCSECSYPNHASSQPIRSMHEDDSSSENSSSFFSEEVGSCSTESTNRDSLSADDYFDQIFGESVGHWNSPRRNSSDSDTSSSSSSHSFLYSRHLPVAGLGSDASRYAETAVDGQGFWAGVLDRYNYVDVSENKGRTPLCPDSAKQCKKLANSSSKETVSSRIGRLNPFDNSKSPRT